jgi:hypothetical protein
MVQNYDESRRKFLKTSIACAAGFATVNPFVNNLHAEEQTVWTDKMPINPSIDNLRVAYCTDASMVTDSTVRWDYDNQNKNVSRTRVSDNMDKMAIALAQKNNVADAWKTIFRKSSSKGWTDVKVAIKVNTQSLYCMPRYAVVVKVCEALINYRGVTPANICIYSCKGITHVANLTKVEDCYGLAANQVKYPYPAGVKIQSNLFSGLCTATVACPGGAVNPVDCLNDLADGTVDILVNIAVNKGHYQAGGVTLCQKNHIGSLKFFCPGKTVAMGMGFYTSGSASDLIALNKTEAIIGGNPVRQQLCIVDSIYAMTNGPVGVPNMQPNTLIMGTFGGAVDYLTYYKVRVPLMNAVSAYTDDVNAFITGYGYSTTERDNLNNLVPGSNGGRGWVNALTHAPGVAG